MSHVDTHKAFYKMLTLIERGITLALAHHNNTQRDFVTLGINNPHLPVKLTYATSREISSMFQALCDHPLETIQALETFRLLSVRELIHRFTANGWEGDILGALQTYGLHRLSAEQAALVWLNLPFEIKFVDFHEMMLFSRGVLSDRLLLRLQPYLHLSTAPLYDPITIHESEGMLERD